MPDEDVREYLENTHTRDVLYHTDTPVTAVMDYIEAASGYSGAHESHGSTYAVDDERCILSKGSNNRIVYVLYFISIF